MANHKVSARGLAFRKAVGEKIRAIREKRKLTALDLAVAIDVDPSGVMRWERGENVPPLMRLLDVAAALECSRDELLPSDKKWREAFRSFEGDEES
jgi:transcriptional regulator with XRE-family HTH domain